MKIAALKRVPGDRYGNPAWEVTFADGLVARTLPGAQVGYLIQNSEYHGVELKVSWQNGKIASVTIVT